MAKTRLNLAALRRTTPAHHSSPAPTLTDLWEADGALRLSRREMLGLAGVAAVTLPTLGRAVAPAVLGPWSVTHDRRRAALRLGSRERWVLDTRAFAGAPRLQVEEAPGLTRLTLAGARFPGTELPADLTAEIRPGLLGWRIRVTMALGGFAAEGPLEGWLAGAEPLRGRFHAEGLACAVNADTRLELAGAGEAEFRPDWTLRVHGRPLARLLLRGQELRGEQLALALLGREDPSLMQAPPASRTLLVLRRGRQQWHLNGSLPRPRAGSLESADNAFDVIRLESGERRGGRAERALLAEALPGGDGSRLSYHAGNGHDVTLPLRDPRWAVAFDSAGDHEALLADFGEPVWWQTENCGLRLGDGPGAGGFEATSSGGVARSLRCTPALLAVMTPLPGAIVEPAPAPEGSTVQVVPEGTRLAQRQAPRPIPVPRPVPKPEPKPEPQPPVVVRPGELGTIVPLLPFTIRVIRPQDLLVLDFQFLNLKLVADAGKKAHIERIKPADAAYVIVGFPPQHIAEEAFLETAAEYSFPNNSGQELKPPPVNSRLAGSSRLAFSVPKTVTKIPYTLESLLDWSQFDLSVPFNALPPPDPPKQFQALGTGGVMQIAPVLLDPNALTTSSATPRLLPVMPWQRRELGTLTPTLSPAGGGRTSRPALLKPLAPLQISPGLLTITPGMLSFAPAKPQPNQTSLELPWRLILSPNVLAGWVHADDPVEHGGRVELWHTRLGVKSADGSVFEYQYQYQRKDGQWRVVNVSLTPDPYGYYRTLRAVWSPDYADVVPQHTDSPFRMSLDGNDRCQMVWLTGNPFVADFRSRTIAGDRVMLSSLGAWLFSRYAAAIPTDKDRGLSVEEWRHQAVMGRDQFVRVVYAGFLFPFGHAASLVKVTERKFEQTSQGKIAYLRQRYFIIVREPEKYYPSMGQQKEGRRMPLRRVRLTSLVTPTLNDPNASRVTEVSIAGQSCFWPRVGNHDFAFHLVGEDWDGQRLDFSCPLIFVSVEKAVGAASGLSYDRANLEKVVTHYLKPENQARREVDLAGQKLALAESTDGKKGDTSLEAQTMTLGAETDTPAPPASPPAGRPTADAYFKAHQPCFFPTLAQAAVKLPAVAALAGSSGVAKVKIHQLYIDGGWSGGGNASEIFAALVDKLPFGFPGDKSGGLAAPNFDISGLSRTMGTVAGDLGKLAAGEFDPSQFFSTAAKILGVVSLADIIDGIFNLDQIPNLTTKVEYDEFDLPKAVTITYKWKPKVLPFPNTGKPVFAVQDSTILEITAIMRVDLRGAAPTATMLARLENFAVHLIPMGDIDYFIRVRFLALKFSSELGKKTDVNCDLGGVDFGGPLNFVKQLTKLIPMGSLSDWFNLDIGLLGITASFSLPLPGVAIGVFAMDNISLGASFELSFTDQPLRVKFNFCTKEQPCLLAVSIFGGGFFFGITVNLSGIELLEAAVEFGGTFSFDIGIASGGAYMMAGLYFTMAGDEATLTGYVRIGGHLSVLGLINISAEFYLGLTYKTAGNQVWGVAKLTVEIEILFFSFSVSLQVEKQFAGSSSSAQLPNGARLAALEGTRLVSADSPPSFEDLMSKQDWKDYCEAFV